MSNCCGNFPACNPGLDLQISGRAVPYREGSNSAQMLGNSCWCRLQPSKVGIVSEVLNSENGEDKKWNESYNW